MKSSATTASGIGDPLAGRAIEGVLEAERDARTAVAACERAGAEVLEAARVKARAVSDRVDARIVALRGRLAQELEHCAARLMEQRMETAAEAVKQLSDPGRLGIAVERVAELLTTETASSHVA